MSQEKQYAIDVLTVTLDILEFLAAHEEKKPTVTMLAQELDLNRTRVYRIVKSLEYRGYLRFEEGSKIIRLGSKLLFLLKTMWERHDIRVAAERQGFHLAKSTGESVRLYIPLEGKAYLVDGFTGTNLLRVEFAPFESYPMYVGASPKILLAYLSDEERESIIQDLEMVPFTSKTITDRDDLRRCLEVIRSRGYEVAFEDMIDGAYSIGAPIFHLPGQIDASLELIIPTVRWTQEDEQRLIHEVTRHARQVSQDLRSGKTVSSLGKF